jgi:predicted glycoside hydrolase/deacetylase ChbG (UPF0249 family)
MPEETLSSTVHFNADDFGWADGQNLAVERAHNEGVLKRASILANGLAFNQAVEIAQRSPGLAVGVHLTLNEGAPLLSYKQLKHLVAPDGEFWQTPADLVRLWMRGHLTAGSVLPEWRTQLERALNAGIHVSHLDSHKHVHMLPPLLDAIILLSKEYGISKIRLPLENIFLAPLRPSSLVLWAFAYRARRYLVRAGRRFSERFIGFGASGKMTLDHLERAVHQAGGRSIEVMVHPAVVTPAVQELVRRYPGLAGYQFEQELEALIRLKIRLVWRGDNYVINGPIY